MPKNKYSRFEWLLGSNMGKSLFTYLFKILLKALTFEEKLSVTIPRTINQYLQAVLCYLLFNLLSIVRLLKLLAMPESHKE